MDKVVLVMNDPICCVNCPLMRSTRKPNIWVCGIPHNNGNVDIFFEPVDIDSDTKPDWCPLKPIPEEYAIPGHPESNYEDGYIDGYNACVDEIVGE